MGTYWRIATTYIGGGHINQYYNVLWLDHLNYKVTKWFGSMWIPTIQSADYKPGVQKSKARKVWSMNLWTKLYCVNNT